MTDPSPPGEDDVPPGPPDARRGRRRILRITVWALVVLVLAVLAVVGDAYYRSYRIYKEVGDLRPELSQIRASLSTGRVPPAALFTRVADATAAARDEAGSWPMGFTGGLPFVGNPVRAVRFGLDAAAEEEQAALLVRGMLSDLVGLDPQAGSPPVFRNGVVDVALLDRMVPRLDAVLRHLRAGDAYLRQIPTSFPGLGSRLASLKQQALADSSQAIRLAERGAAGLRLLPTFLGASGPRTYLLALQNNDDQRGTGGAVLALAVVRVSHGAFTLLRAGSTNELENPKVGEPGLPLPAPVRWYLDATGTIPRLNNGANYSPDFPAVAEAWSMMARRALGYRVDGVLALDPYAVADALENEPPLRVAGLPQPITTNTVVPLTENGQYLLPGPVQKALPGLLIAHAFHVITHPTNFLRLSKNLATALSEQRIQVWSSDPAMEAFVSRLGWDGALRRGPGDFLALAQEKRVANKVDWYTRQSIRYDVTVLPSGAIRSSYTVTLTNSTPRGEPKALVARWTPYAMNLAMLNLYVPGRATGATANPSGTTFGMLRPASYMRSVRPNHFVTHVEGDFLVLTQTVPAWPGHPGRVTFRYTVPGVVQSTPAGKVYELTIQHQPMAHPSDITVRVTLPSGVTVRQAPGWTVDGSIATFHGLLTRDVTLRIVF